jgi:hypothetical protein
LVIFFAGFFAAAFFAGFLALARLAAFLTIFFLAAFIPLSMPEEFARSFSAFRRAGRDSGVE